MVGRGEGWFDFGVGFGAGHLLVRIGTGGFSVRTFGIKSWCGFWGGIFALPSRNGSRYVRDGSVAVTHGPYVLRIDRWGRLFRLGAAESCCQPRGPRRHVRETEPHCLLGLRLHPHFTRVAVDAAGQRVSLKAAARSTAGTYVPIVTHDYC